MDIIYVLIGFVCGFICRQVILHQQMVKAKADFEQIMKTIERKQDGE